MRLSKEIIDKEKKACYGKRGGRISALFIDSREELSEERLLQALSLILSEKDVIDYFKSRKHSFRPAHKGVQDKKEHNFFQA